MAFRTQAQNISGPPSSFYPSAMPSQGNAPHQDDSYNPSPSPTLRSKRPRPLDMQHDDGPTTTSDSFIQDNDANDDGDEDDDDEGDPKKSDKKAGRRKIKIEFIQDKSRRHITFSKRKAGIMKKAYELSTLTGTQVLLLVVSETGLVYTFTTAKLQPLVTQPEGKNLIQACLNAPHGQLPNSASGGQPMNRMNSNSQSSRSNVPGGLSIGNKDEDGDGEDEDEGNTASTPTSAKPRTRRRTSSGAVAGGVPPASANAGSGKTATASPTSPNQSAPTPSIPMHQQAPPQPSMGISTAPGGHGQPQNYSPQNHSPVPNVGYSGPPDAGGYMQHPGHPSMMQHYHIPQNQQHTGHWTGPAQPVSQGNQYRR